MISVLCIYIFVVPFRIVSAALVFRKANSFKIVLVWQILSVRNTNALQLVFPCIVDKITIFLERFLKRAGRRK